MFSFLNLLNIEPDSSNPISTLINPHSFFNVWFTYWCVRLFYFGLALICLHCLIDYVFLGVRPYKMNFVHTKNNTHISRVKIKHRIVTALVSFIIFVPLTLAFGFCGITVTTKDTYAFNAFTL